MGLDETLLKCPDFVQQISVNSMKIHSYNCHKNILENGKLVKAGYLLIKERLSIVNSWALCLENNQLVITSGIPTVNFRK